MAGHVTLPETYLSADAIPAYRTQQHPTTFQACSQVGQIFLKADGKISCSCMRYRDILADARAVNVAKFYNGELMRYIRESFRAGKEPFSICQACPSRIAIYPNLGASAQVISLHIEPSSQCNLFCAACTCTHERQSDNPPPRANLDFALYDKMVRDIDISGLYMHSISFVGFGEPLFNSRTHEMAALGRRLFPLTRIVLDTNGNFGERRAEEIAACGIDEIRLGLDGVDQATYVGYRQSGNFAKAFAFADRLAKTIHAKGSKTRAVWKYILFSHNDRDEHIDAAIRMANEIGIELIFDYTVGPIASKRPAADLQAHIGARQLACNIERSAYLA